MIQDTFQKIINPPVVEDFVEVINFNFNELTGVQWTFQGPLKVLIEKSEKNMVRPGLDPLILHDCTTLKIPYLAFSFQLHQIPSQGYLDGARFLLPQQVSLKRTSEAAL